MEFRMIYQGPLPSNGSVKEKHQIRKIFQAQLKELWNQVPLSTHRNLLEYPPKNEGDISVIRKVRDFDFAPLVCSDLKMYAEIDITLLRPGPLGSIITQGGDIDNRLKTLFDALRYPKEPQEIPKGISPDDDEKPFFCLLEDDQLINKISVSVDRLLIPAKADEVYLTLFVKLKGVTASWGNIGLIT